jgi:hypothetical protein
MAYNSEESWVSSSAAPFSYNAMAFLTAESPLKKPDMSIMGMGRTFI